MPRVFTLLRIAILLSALAVATPAAQAVILEDFPFSDPNDTPLDNVVNTINLTNTWILGGNSWDPSAVVNGSFRIDKTSTSLATAHIDIANVTTGKVWLVAEMSGWNYTATPSSTSEEVRLSFLDNDNDPPSGSTITAQMQINRSGGGLALVGNALPAGTATNIAGSYALPLVRSSPFAMVLELDKNLDQYSVYYKDDTDPYQLLGTGELGVSTLNPGDRDGNSFRFASTGMFNDTGEFFDIDRIYLTDTSPIGGPVEPVGLTLQVLSNGQVNIFNDTDTAISLNSYRVASPTSALNFAEWISLSDQNIDPVGGGNDPGETWDEAGGSNDDVLAESFLLGSSTIVPTGSLSLGRAFQPAGMHNVTFQYLDSVSGAVTVGAVDYVVVAGVAGDYNDDGTVDAADYVIWRKHQGTTNTLPNDPTGGMIGTAQYNTNGSKRLVWLTTKKLVRAGS